MTDDNGVLRVTSRDYWFKIVDMLQQNWALIDVVILIAAGLIWEQHHDWVFYLIAIGLVLGFALVAFGVREHKQLGDGEKKKPTDSMLKPSLAPYIGYVRDRWRESREAVKLLLVRFLYQIGINAAVPFLTLFVSTQIGTAGWRELVSVIPGLAGIVLDDKTGMTVGTLDAQGISQIVAALFLLITLIFAIPSGWLGDRFGKKRVFRIGLLVMGVMALMGASSRVFIKLKVSSIWEITPQHRKLLAMTRK